MATLAKQIIIFSSAAKFRTCLCTFFQSMASVWLGTDRAASPRGLVHSDLLASLGQLAAWHLSQQSLLSKHNIYHCCSQKDGTYLMGGQKHLLLPYAGNCQGLFMPRLATLSARKQAFPKACQKNTNKNFKRTNFHISHFVLRSCVNKLCRTANYGHFSGVDTLNTKKKSSSHLWNEKGLKKSQTYINIRLDLTPWRVGRGAHLSSVT